MAIYLSMIEILISFSKIRKKKGKKKNEQVTGIGYLNRLAFLIGKLVSYMID